MLKSIFLTTLCAVLACGFVHPAYEDYQSESDDRCVWCVNHIEPSIKKAIRDSTSSDDTKATIEGVLRALIVSTESEDEAEMIREEIEMTLWDTNRMRQISALQRFYHAHPTLRDYFDRLVDHVICGCRVQDIPAHDRTMDKVLQFHAQALRMEYKVHGYPEGSEPPKQPNRGRKSRRSQNDEL